MKNQILLLRPHDYKIINNSIGIIDWSNTIVSSFNIEAIQIALDSGAENIKLLESAEIATTNTSQCHINADREARLFDISSAALKSNHLKLDINFQGWEYLNYYFMKYTYYRYEALAQFLLKDLPDCDNLMMVWNNNPQDYYFDSKLLRSVVVNKLNSRFNKIIGFSSKISSVFREDAFNYSLSIPDGNFKKLTHLPTTFYSASKLKSQLVLDEAIDIQSPYFDIPYSSNRATLSGNVDSSVHSDYSRKYIELFKSLDENYNIYIDSNQEIRILKRAIFQLNSFLELTKAKSLSKLQELHLADHDCGLQGPLNSFAALKQISVTYWPHSTLTNLPVPSNNLSTTNIKSALKKESGYISLGHKQYNVSHIEKNNNKITLIRKNILFLHNELDDVAGAPLVILSQFRDYYEQLIKYLLKSDFNIKSRQKPSHKYKDLIPDIVESADGDMSLLIEWADICISIGVPTTAMINFWKKGCLCIHLHHHSLTELDEYTLPQGVKIINISYSDIINEIENFIKANE